MMASLVAAAAALVLQMGGVPVQYTTTGSAPMAMPPSGQPGEGVVSTAELEPGTPVLMINGQFWNVRITPTVSNGFANVSLIHPSAPGQFKAKVPVSAINTPIWVLSMGIDTDTEESTSDTPLPDDPIVIDPVLGDPVTPPSTEPVVPTP